MLIGRPPRNMMRWAGVEVVFGQSRRRLTSSEPAMGCDAGPALNRNRVRMTTSCVGGTS